MLLDLTVARSESHVSEGNAAALATQPATEISRGIRQAQLRSRS